MEVRFNDRKLDRLETDSRFTARLPIEVVRSYRKAVQYLRAASDERDIRARKSFHFESLRGRPGQYSLRLNVQFRLIVEFEAVASGTVVVIVSVEDYH